MSCIKNSLSGVKAVQCHFRNVLDEFGQNTCYPLMFELLIHRLFKEFTLCVNLSFLSCFCTFCEFLTFKCLFKKKIKCLKMYDCFQCIFWSFM